MNPFIVIQYVITNLVNQGRPHIVDTFREYFRICSATSGAVYQSADDRLGAITTGSDVNPLPYGPKYDTGTNHSPDVTLDMDPIRPGSAVSCAHARECHASTEGSVMIFCIDDHPN